MAASTISFLRAASVLLAISCIVFPAASFSAPRLRTENGGVISNGGSWAVGAHQGLKSSNANNPIIRHDSRTTSTAICMNFSPPGDNDPTGLKEGFILFGVALAVSVWIFSIPPEFRRARLCSEEDVRLYPDKNCMTIQQWTGGISDYYASGGGVDFDFSVDPDSMFKK